MSVNAKPPKSQCGCFGKFRKFQNRLRLFITFVYFQLVFGLTCVNAFGKADYDGLYTAGGDLFQTSFDGLGKTSSVLHASFVVGVSNDVWRITIVYMEGSANSIVAKSYDRTEDAGFNGTNVYTVTTSRNAITNAAIEVRGMPGSIGPDNNQFPLNLSSYGRFLWLALGSSHYFVGATNGVVIPAPWSVNAMGTQAKCADLAFMSSPHLPFSIHFTTSPTPIAGLTNNSPWKTEIPSNYLAGSYAVLTKTNMEGMELPLEFELRKFFPPRSTLQTSSPHLMLLIRGEINSMHNAGPAQPLPTLPLVPKIVVRDERFGGVTNVVSSLHYFVTNGVWPDRNSVGQEYQPN